MILQDNGHIRCEGGQRYHLTGKIQAVHMQHIGSESSQQLGQRIAEHCRCCACKRHEVVGNTVPDDLPAVAAGLYDRDASPGPMHAIGDIAQTRPVLKQLLGLPSAGVIEKTDLRNVHCRTPASRGRRRVGPTSG